MVSNDSMRTLWILMWKHLTVRKRRYIATPVELIAPCLFFILLFTLKTILISSNAPLHAKNVHNTDIIALDSLRTGPSLILYTPDTPQTNMLMEEVGRKLGLPQRTTIPEPNSRGIYAFSNDSLSNTFFHKTVEDMKDTTAVVIFRDMESGAWPERLNYTVRMKVNFMTHTYESLDDEDGPHQGFGTIYEPFMRLQWSIDTSYLKLVTGTDINTAVLLQEFPFVGSVYNQAAKGMADILKKICCLSLLVPYVFLMSRLLEMRATGVQELLRMVGVSQPTLWLSHVVNVTPVGLVYAIVGAVLLSVGKVGFIEYSSGFLIFMLLFVYFYTVVALAFVCSFITKSKQYIVTVAVLSFVVFYIPCEYLDEYRAPLGLQCLMGLVPHMPMYWFWRELGSLETFGQSMSISEVFTRHTNLSLPVSVCFLYMFIQMLLYYFIAWYLSKVVPGKYGISLPMNFLFQRSYWSKKVTPSIPASLLDEEEQPISRDPLYFEDLSGGKVGIKVANVTKIFGKTRALNNVSFDVLQGEITVLLGHNGAGKTTIMSIITGMIGATDGHVFVNGSDITRDQKKLHQQVGLCTQHNISFPNLTVYEHVMFFSLLKGKSFADARKASKVLLAQLGLEEKAGSRSAELSGGMKRRLQLGIALAGDANVLVLDEPTSGLDVETRRELWDLLLSLRGSRTVVLSTHFMEEADALGDRVVALHTGTVRCHATPMYLKKSIGTGYRLSLTTIGEPKEAAITSLIQSVVPGASVKEKSFNSLSYNLPATESKQFPKLFTNLEANRSQLGVDSIGVGVSTLEEVFLKLCSDVTTSFDGDTVDGVAPAEPTYEKVTGLRLYLRQMYVLIRRQFKYIMFNKIMFFSLQIIIPVIVICLVTVLVTKQESKKSEDNSEALMNLNLFKDKFDKRALYKLVNPSSIESIKRQFKNVQFRATPSVADAVMRAGEDDLTEYNKYLVGIEMNDTTAKILYTTTIRHAAPVALNLLSNIIASEVLAGASGGSISTANHPLQGARLQPEPAMREPLEAMDARFWAIVVMFILLGAVMNGMMLPIKERLSGARHIHTMAGCPPALHWLSALLSHTAVYTALLVTPTVVVVHFDKHDTLNQPAFVGAAFVVLLLSVLSFLAFVYMVSWACSERAAGLLVSVLIVALGVIPAIANVVGRELGVNKWKVFLQILHVTFPAYTATMGLVNAADSARGNAYCQLNVDKCPNISGGYLFKNFDVNKCCVTKELQKCYFCLEHNAPGVEMLIMFLQLIFYMIIVLLAQYGLLNGLKDRLTNTRYRPKPHRFNDEMVRAEKTYVDKGITLPPKQIQDAMLINNLHKNYFRCLHPRSPVNAVRGISLSIKKGECFGLLGVNGAGKSTTFKMISAEECPTKGNIFANGHHLKWPRGNYLTSLGYCPQFFGLDHFMSGRDNLRLLLTLRGQPAAAVRAEADSWINVVGLQKYQKFTVDGYSGGCLRRLGAAAALAGGAPLTLLDEPTAGVDVAARRRVWAALRRGLRQGRAVIITSHSMDEMEALCDRIAILSAGELGALGSPAGLRARHAAGHAVLLKLAAAARGRDETDGPGGVNSLKQSLQETFNCTLKDEHGTMLHYHINETMRYSELFTTLEDLKKAFPQLVEDYSVTETTLEEVFLSFAQLPPQAGGTSV